MRPGSASPGCFYYKIGGKSMGKRELFIALAFVAAGVIAYQMTAPEPAPGQAGFSLSRVWNRARQGVRANAAQATATSRASAEVSPQLAELRVDGLLTGRVRLVGETRADIAYELTVRSTGPDPQTALEYARRVRVQTDDLGSALTLRMDYPRDVRQSALLVVRLPARLTVLVSGGGGAEVSNVAGAQLDGIAGDVTVSAVRGTVAGTQRNGSIAVTDAGAVKMSLQRSRASFARIAREVTLDLRDGECHVSDAGGPVEIDEVRAEVTLVRPAGPVRIGGADGRITIVDPRARSSVDVRRAEVEVQLSAAAPLTLLTTDDTLRLLLDGPPPVTIDAVATLGRIDAREFGLQPEERDQEQHLAHDFGASGAPRVSLRNARGEILIKKSSEAIENREGK